jgi:hypothetical protein
MQVILKADRVVEAEWQKSGSLVQSVFHLYECGRKRSSGPEI